MTEREIPAPLIPLIDGIGKVPEKDEPTSAQKAAKVEHLKSREATTAKQDAEWSRRMDSARGSAPTLVEIAPDHPCDRCSHPSKYHAGPDRGSRCMIVGAKVWHGETIPKGMRARACPCDCYFPR